MARRRVPAQRQLDRAWEIHVDRHTDHVGRQRRLAAQHGGGYRLEDHRHAREDIGAMLKHEHQRLFAANDDHLGWPGAVFVAQVSGDRVAIGCATELRSIQKLGGQVHARVGMCRKCRVQASVELHVGRQQTAVGVQHQHVARFRGRGRNGAKQPQTHEQKTPQRVSQPRGRAMRSRTGSHNQGTLSFAGCGSCKSSVSAARTGPAIPSTATQTTCAWGAQGFGRFCDHMPSSMWPTRPSASTRPFRPRRCLQAARCGAGNGSRSLAQVGGAGQPPRRRATMNNRGKASSRLPSARAG